MYTCQKNTFKGNYTNLSKKKSVWLETIIVWPKTNYVCLCNTMQKSRQLFVQFARYKETLEKQTVNGKNKIIFEQQKVI